MPPCSVKDMKIWNRHELFVSAVYFSVLKHLGICLTFIIVPAFPSYDLSFFATIWIFWHTLMMSVSICQRQMWTMYRWRWFTSCSGTARRFLCSNSSWAERLQEQVTVHCLFSSHSYSIFSFQSVAFRFCIPFCPFTAYSLMLNTSFTRGRGHAVPYR